MKNSKNGPRASKPNIRLDLKGDFHDTKEKLDSLGLNTVCQEAHCPNRLSCWNDKTATFLLMGDICTRNCRFCAGKFGKPNAIDPTEPDRVREASVDLGLKYVVITSVTRDDLHDGGAGHFGRCIEELKKSGASVEALIPDFSGNLDALSRVVRAEPQVISHNIETVRRLQKTVRDKRFGYETSLKILHATKELDSGVKTKSSIMVGLGESHDEIIDTMKDLRAANVDILTIGQYLQPSPKHLPVDTYVELEKFDEYEKIGLDLGFKYVASSPLVRSSYKAEEAYLKTMGGSF